ncbi:YcaO-like family protein [Streptomyces actuosus]|uniref:YcaO-like family protein n=1 Tax=Streptomyces actuosus TaxID=1885 RepID=A0ABS2VY19_STRAS|nr:YcaO-like family protein [Streptomyces actuosus]MBN0048022.1 YcaO-like family protein [Streptomyces actuosus]
MNAAAGPVPQAPSASAPPVRAAAPEGGPAGGPEARADKIPPTADRPASGPATGAAAEVLAGPDAPAGWDWTGWAQHPGVGVVAVSGAYDRAWEQSVLSTARVRGTGLLSVRVDAGSVLVGPLWLPPEAAGEAGAPPACAGCLVTRRSHRHRPEGEELLRFAAESRAAATPPAPPAPSERPAAAGADTSSPSGHTATAGPVLSAEAAAPARSGPAAPTAPDAPAGVPPTASAAPSGRAPALSGGRRPVPPRPPWLRHAAEVYGAVVAAAPLNPGELVVLRADGSVRRHRLRRTYRCPVCGVPGAPGDASRPPSAPRLRPRPSASSVPTRAGAPFGMDADRMRAALADSGFGPAVRVSRDAHVPFAMSEVRLLGGSPAGHGRARTYGEAEAVAYLEAYERMAGYPHGVAPVTGRSPAELGERALDPARLGGYTDAQLAHPLSRVRPWDADTRMDWVWAHRLRDGRPLLVPADAGFYQYRYPPREPGDRRLNHVLESSSGCALGSSYEEAALHSLLELAERDAFLLAWHRRRPLPEIDPATVRDPQSRLLLHMAGARGFEVRLLAATADIAVPVVWALALRRDGALPAAFSTAGGSPDPEAAVRAALWELAQLTETGLTWDPAAVEPMIADRCLVDDLMDHPRRNADPRLLPRVTEVLGGPVLPLTDAFPDWPGAYARAARGDVTRGLGFVAELYEAAGLPDVLLVDQTTPEHADAGLAVVKAVVPGIVPMCFGQVHQRFTGLRRLLDGLPDPRPAPAPGDGAGPPRGIDVSAVAAPPRPGGPHDGSGPAGSPVDLDHLDPHPFP